MDQATITSGTINEPKKLGANQAFRTVALICCIVSINVGSVVRSRPIITEHA
jgi:non-canonical (house-cleaning) NTP pyrophosphatase